MSTTSGWGRFTWGQANWNEDTTLKVGWGAQAWSDGEWGELKDAIALPTGLSITASVGSVDVPDQISLHLQVLKLQLHKEKLLFLFL